MTLIHSTLIRTLADQLSFYVCLFGWPPGSLRVVTRISLSFYLVQDLHVLYIEKSGVWLCSPGFFPSPHVFLFPAVTLLINKVNIPWEDVFK